CTSRTTSTWPGRPPSTAPTPSSRALAPRPRRAAPSGSRPRSTASSGSGPSAAGCTGSPRPSPRSAPDGPAPRRGWCLTAGWGREALLLELAYDVEEARPFARIQGWA
ncbi:MAG: hypothetical protein AVDCRST_MAG06-778, partial [uncultured Nocardioides sp.]